MRATHVETPSFDDSERYPDLYAEHREDEEHEPDRDPGKDDAPSPARRLRARSRAPSRSPTRSPSRCPARTRAEPAAEELTPMGARRSAVTEADDFDYRQPAPSFLKRSSGAQKADTKGIERTGGAARARR